VTDDILRSLNAKLQMFADLERALGGNNALAMIAEDMERHKRVLSAAYGPVEELRRSGALAAFSEQSGAIAELQKRLALATERFELPHSR
jgi:hypothetical protein